MRQRIILFLLSLMAVITVHAQNSDDQWRAIYDHAEQNYTIGRLEEAEAELRENLRNFPGDLRQSAYRMLSLCCLGLDRDDDARSYTQQLLNDNPYFTPLITDPQRFIDMVENIKGGRTATITTASSQAEKLNEVPVPTMLITEQMIRDCGARNLQEVLAAYVPGMHIVDCNDDINIAMRGIFSNGQEKILIMLNGHRLNSYCTNTAAPDFSISLDKLKQIEVLRGPASSLYGGVSLTAVVNLITKQGADVDGLEARAGIGSYGQLKGSMMLGKRYFDLDMLVWGSFYRAEGQNRWVNAEDTGFKIADGNVNIGGIGPKPSYDVGIALKYKNLQFLYNTHYSQIESPMSMTYSFSPYNINEYRTYNGIRPSFATNSHHAELSYGQQFGSSVYLKGFVTYDNSDLTHYNVITEPAVPALVEILPLPPSVTDLIANSGGISRYINGQEHTFGGKLQGDWTYAASDDNKGLLTFGTEYSYFKLDDVRYTFGYNHTQTVPENDTIPKLGKGHESNLNIYGQLKHQWRSFILNAGLRFDYKNRYNNTKIREFSPRLALIYVQPKWNVKLSYSKAFIDAPYLYRKSNLFLASMLHMTDLTEELDPEELHSWQLTFGSTEWAEGLNFDVNFFFNHAKNLIYLELYEHYNTGFIDSYGLEFSGNYTRNRLMANLSVTWQKVKKVSIFDQDFDRQHCTPELNINGVLAYQLTRNLRLNTHIAFDSKQNNFWLNLIAYGAYMKLSQYYQELIRREIDKPGSVSIEEMNKINDDMQYWSSCYHVERKVPARIVVDLGATYSLGRFSVGLNIKNIFNNHYSQGGMSTGLIPQRGRWALFEVAYKF